jgi:hypothetical protein
MSDAVKLIVDGLVRLRDRQGLEDLRQHRQKLRRDLQLKSGSAFDVSRSVRVLDDDLRAIEAGFGRLG